MFCTSCGAEVADNVKFCPKCGASMFVDTNNSNGANPNVGYNNYNEYNNGNNGYNNYNQYNQPSNSSMDAKTTSIVAYITWIGFIIAICAGDKQNAKFWLNQALVYHLFCLVGFVPVIGWAWSIFMLVCFILGLIYATNQEYKELPLIGKLHILN